MVNKHVIESLLELCFVALNVVTDRHCFLHKKFFGRPLKLAHSYLFNMFFFLSCKRFICLPGVLHYCFYNLGCSHKNCHEVSWLFYASVYWQKCSKFVNLKCVLLNPIITHFIVLYDTPTKEIYYDSHKN